MKKDIEIIERFFAAFDYLDNQLYLENIEDRKRHQLNHSIQPEREIAINLAEFSYECRRYNLFSLDTNELKVNLKYSIRHEFIANKNIHSRISKTSKRCWVFKR